MHTFATVLLQLLMSKCHVPSIFLFYHNCTLLPLPLFSLSCSLFLKSHSHCLLVKMSVCGKEILNQVRGLRSYVYFCHIHSPPVGSIWLIPPVAGEGSSLPLTKLGGCLSAVTKYLKYQCLALFSCYNIAQLGAVVQSAVMCSLYVCVCVASQKSLSLSLFFISSPLLPSLSSLALLPLPLLYTPFHLLSLLPQGDSVPFFMRNLETVGQLVRL